MTTPCSRSRQVLPTKPILLLTQAISLFIFTSTLLLPTTTTAQSSVPVPVRQPAYLTSPDEKTLYVVGGLTVGARSVHSAQTFALDLSAAWSTTNPPWTTLSPFPFSLQSNALYGTLTPDSKSFWVTSEGSNWAQLRLENQSWTQAVPLPSTFFSSLGGHAAATDFTTGKIIVPSAFFEAGTSNVDRDTLVYSWPENRATGAAGTGSAGVGVSSELKHYGLAYSSLRGSVLLYGGFGANVEDINGKLLEFSSATSSWKIVTTNGWPVPPLVSPCMVSAYKGTKMVLFGGSLNSNFSSLSDGIYILDIQSLSWSRGQKVEPAWQRTGHVCGVAGDNLVTWGGVGVNNATLSSYNPLVFNIPNEQWIDQFTPPGGSGSSSSSNVGAIAGGVVGGLVVLFLAGCIFGRRRQRKALGAQTLDHAEYQNNPPKDEVHQGYPGMPDGNSFGAGAIKAEAGIHGTHTTTAPAAHDSVYHPIKSELGPGPVQYFPTGQPSPTQQQPQPPRHPQEQQQGSISPAGTLEPQLYPNVVPLQPQLYPSQHASPLQPGPQIYPVAQPGPQAYPAAQNPQDRQSYDQQQQQTQQHQQHQQQQQPYQPYQEQYPYQQPQHPQQLPPSSPQQMLYYPPPPPTTASASPNIYHATTQPGTSTDLRLQQQQQPSPIRHPQQREDGVFVGPSGTGSGSGAGSGGVVESEVDRQVRIQQQELEQLEFAQQIHRKKMEIERLLDQRKQQQ